MQSWPHQKHNKIKIFDKNAVLTPPKNIIEYWLYQNVIYLHVYFYFNWSDSLFLNFGYKNCSCISLLFSACVLSFIFFLCIMLLSLIEWDSLIILLTSFLSFFELFWIVLASFLSIFELFLSVLASSLRISSSLFVWSSFLTVWGSFLIVWGFFVTISMSLLVLFSLIAWDFLIKLLIYFLITFEIFRIVLAFLLNIFALFLSALTSSLRISSLRLVWGSF